MDVLWFIYSSVEGHLFPVFIEYQLSSCKHLYIGFCMNMFLFFSGKYIGGVLLDCMVCV